MVKLTYTKSFRKLKKLVITIVLAMTILFVLLTSRLIFVNHFYSENPMFTGGELEVVMIDVANGDSFLILQNNQALLVDSGYFTTYSNVKKTLEEYHINKLDYVILTHPHRDHEGGFLRLLFDYHIDNILIQHDLGNFQMSTTEQAFYLVSEATIKYENFFNHNLIEIPSNLTFADSELEFYDTTPNGIDYLSLNNYTLVFKMVYKDVSILFTGDLQKEAETILLQSNVDLSSTILKLGHHGSNTSTSAIFLKRVSPKYAMVSCHNGVKNSYGHPNKSVLDLLEHNNIILYRTDELGNVKMTTNGKNIVFDNNPGDYLSGNTLLKQATNSVIH